MALLLSLQPRLAVPARIYLTAGATTALALLTLAMTTKLTTAAIAALTLGCAAAAVAGTVLPQLHTRTDPTHIGRVMSMFYFLTAGLAPLSLATMSFLITSTSTSTSTALATAATLAAIASLLARLGARNTTS